MASAKRAASRPIRQRTVPSSEFAGRELRLTNDTCRQNTRRPVPRRFVVVAIRQRATSRFYRGSCQLLLQIIVSPFQYANQTRLSITQPSAPALRPAKMEFRAADLLHPPRERPLN